MAITLTFCCPHCERSSRVELRADERLRCPDCNESWELPAGALAGGQLTRCLVCPSDELYVRKDFSQRWGLAIIVVGFVASSVAWYFHRPYWTYGILVGTALLDLLLFLLVGDLLQCYRCHAEYRGLSGLESHGYFSLETHERYRQQQARLEQAELEQNQLEQARLERSRRAAELERAGLAPDDASRRSLS